MIFLIVLHIFFFQPTKRFSCVRPCLGPLFSTERQVKTTLCLDLIQTDQGFVLDYIIIPHWSVVSNV